MARSWTWLVLSISVLALLSGCAERPRRPHVSMIVSDLTGCRSTLPAGEPRRSSPITADKPPPYRLHFLEFDDQGWPYQKPDATPGMDDQVDCAISDLAQTLRNDKDVLAFVYVHGWKHSADEEDSDLQKFKELLAEQARKVQGRRQVIGFYIGWNGKTLDVPFAENLTFWARKNAAHHVSEGSIREFFSRMKALRDAYNRTGGRREDPVQASDCGKPDGDFLKHPCPLRTVMIGHSFGALVLYAATAPYILETLASISQRDVKRQVPRTWRERGIADLVVLLNPAFQGSMYEPMFRAVRRYTHETYAPPLLVSVTSTADWATRYAFPAGRLFNTMLQYPATTSEESEAMRSTHGHIDRYITHELVRGSAGGPNANVVACGGPSGATPSSVRRQFFAGFTKDDVLHLKPEWSRPMCDGLVLRQLKSSGPYDLVWNVRTDKSIVAHHNDITQPALISFIEQIYDEVSSAPPLKFGSSPPQ